MRSSAIASTHAVAPQGVAWNAIARNAIMADPAWQGGHYYGTGRKPDAGMGIARMVGHITYLSAKSVGDKFGRRLQFADDIRYTMTEPGISRSKVTCGIRRIRSSNGSTRTPIFTRRAR